MNTQTTLMAVLTTVGTQEQARSLARQMVEVRLAACAQISAIESIYAWKDSIEQEAEWRVVFKTTQAQCAALQNALQEAHPYETPMIVALKLDEVNAAYVQWAAEQCSGAAG